MTEENIFQRSVPVKLTPDEFITMGKKIGREQNEMNALKNQAKEVAADYKAKIVSKQTTVDSLSITISNGYEHRPVDCMYSFRPLDREKDIIRLDTLEIVATEKMVKEDFQEDLPLEKGKEKKGR